jgi:hypothetical protein
MKPQNQFGWDTQQMNQLAQLMAAHITPSGILKIEGHEPTPPTTVISALQDEIKAQYEHIAGRTVREGRRYTNSSQYDDDKKYLSRLRSSFKFMRDGR